jgi:hypothetical protein
MRRLIAVSLGVGFGVLALPVSVSAELVTLRFTGHVTVGASDPGVLAAIPVGSAIEIVFSYDSETQERMTPVWQGLGNPTLGTYWSNTFDMDVTIGGYGLSSPHIAQFFFVDTERARINFDNSLSEILLGDRIFTAEHTYRPHYIDWQFQWPGEQFASDALPTALSVAPGEGTFQFGLERCRTITDCTPQGAIGRQGTQMRGVLTTAASIPEPGTLGLVLLGAASALTTLRKKTSR